VIIVDQQLCNKLSDDEMRNLLSRIVPRQPRLNPGTRLDQTPIIGTLLFFLFLNLEKIYNDEYRADEFAAQQVNC